MSKVETTFKNKINEAFDNVVYVGGYKGSRSKSTVKLKCLLCGETNQMSTSLARRYPTGRSQFQCNYCMETHRLRVTPEDNDRTKREHLTKTVKEKPTKEMTVWELNFKESREIVHEHLTYMCGYQNELSNVYIRCDKCGTVDERSATSTKANIRGRHNYTCQECGFIHKTSEREVDCEVCGDTYKTRNIKGNVCEACVQAEEQRITKEHNQLVSKIMSMFKKMISNKNRIVKDIEREKQREIDRTKLNISNCTKCNKLFSYIGHKETVCNECIRVTQRVNEYNKDKIRRKKMQKNGKYNSDIDLDAVIDRYDNVCYLCGGQCDKADHEWKSGVFYVGRNYPSIEHVIPISKGGTHTWDNVNLAHHYCNSIKSDTI